MSPGFDFSSFPILFTDRLRLRQLTHADAEGMMAIWDRSNRRIDIGYHIRPAHWGHGYATEAAHTIVGWCFQNLDLHRILADCVDGNLASERMLLKCGFTVEGLWRKSCWEHGRFVSIKQFGLLRHEFIPTT